MPIYQFICEKCNCEFREFANVSDKKSGKIKCTECGSGDLQEIYSVNVKGKGGDSCGSCSSGSCSSCG